MPNDGDDMNPNKSTRSHGAGQEPQNAERLALAAAIADHATAGQHAAMATEAAGLGRAAAEAAEVALAAFAATDGAVAAHRAAALRNGTGTALSAELVDQRQRQAAALLEAEDAARTAALLDREAAAASAALAVAAVAVDDAVIEVRIDLAEQAMQEMSKAEAEAGRLRVIAATFADGFSLDQAERFRGKMPKGITVLGYDLAHGLLVDRSAIGSLEAAACWKQFARELREDPDAVAPSQISVGA